MFTIKRRYQYRGPKGIAWTSWFSYDETETAEEAKQLVKSLSKKKEPTKLLSEYLIEES